MNALKTRFWNLGNDNVATRYLCRFDIPPIQAVADEADRFANLSMHVGDNLYVAILASYGVLQSGDQS